MNVARPAIDGIGLLLFVPGNRPERFAKAAAAGADGIIIDLEDAVDAHDKDAARRGLAEALGTLDTLHTPVFVRVNSAGTPWHAQDVETLAALPIAGIVLPKAERVIDIERVAQAIGGAGRVIALVETAAGLAAVRSLAAASGRIAFGSIDYAADISAAHSREALLHARSELVLASRLAGLPGPIDGVTVAIDSENEIEADARNSATLGFSGKLLIHPRQVAPAARGFLPSEAEIAWAERVVAASAGSGVNVVDGGMVDAPVRARAVQVLRRAAKFTSRRHT